MNKRTPNPLSARILGLTWLHHMGNKKLVFLYIVLNNIFGFYRYKTIKRKDLPAINA